MPELGPYGFVRGARGNSRPYRDPRSRADIGGWRRATQGVVARSRTRARRIYVFRIPRVLTLPVLG
jgi:hypothetical protein